MPPSSSVGSAPDALARRALIITAALSLVGSGLGALGIGQGVVTGALVPLILSCVAFSLVTLGALLLVRSIALQTVATAATVYFALYLSAGSVIAITGDAAGRMNLFVFLIWFLPLRVFNELVNSPAVGRLLAKSLAIAPIVILVTFAVQLRAIFPLRSQLFLIAFCLSYAGFGVMFAVITRYREDFVAQREREESLKIESAILESISDCFISLDAELRFVYLNDAACAEFAIGAQAVLGRRPADVLPHIFSARMVSGIRDALGAPSVTAFEACDPGGDSWYEMRCFPRPDGVSVYFRNVTDRRAADAQIQHLAFHDALTDLPNRVMLRAQLGTALARAARQRSFGALLFIDLDDFKTLNDTLGHDVGDTFLKEIAQRLLVCVRGEDTVARLGGDEFVVLLEAIADDVRSAAERAQFVAEKIAHALSAPYRSQAVEHASSAGIGIALFDGPPDTADDLLKRADLAMYRAKALGRNAVCFFDPVMQTSVVARAELLSDLRLASAHGEFELYYQPQVDRGGGVTGAEALLRWNHPRRGQVPPSDFIPLAEEAGLIADVGRWVLDAACRELARWSQHPQRLDLILAVNVSPRQFADAHFVDVVLAALRDSGAEPTRLKLELTESFALQNVDDTVAKMTELRCHGIGFSIDDFGTGYSSLSLLKRLPLDQLKIDRSFVLDISADNADASIVRALVALGKSLDLEVIAEGVETATQRDLLERAGCLFYQGHLFSPALPVAEFEAFVDCSPAMVGA